VKVNENRFYLRGLRDFFYDTKEKHIFTDLMHFVEEIVSKTSDLFVLHKIPPSKEKTGTFKNEIGLGEPFFDIYLIDQISAQHLN